MKLHIVLFVFLILVPFSVCAGQHTPAAVPEYLLEVSFDIPQSKIIGTAAFNVLPGQEISLSTGDLSINEVMLNGQKVDVAVQEKVLKLKPLQSGELVIRYEGVFKGDNAVSTANYGVTESVISEKGVSLTGIWYPQIHGLCRYRLKALLPPGYQAISEAERIEKSAENGGEAFTFDFPHPVDGINLVASSRYEEIRDTFNAIELYAYFFPEDRELATAYLAYTKKYLQQFENLIGPYPYKRFSIVENFLPTGYSMPTYTLLGQDVVRLPFIVETSLGHEILHQWFGNYVYIDYEKGNWAEGLTTYLADHRFEEQKGKGWEYRKQILIDYESYVNSRNEVALKDFRGRTDNASKAIGYGKAALIFHMLKNRAGEDAFITALREFVKEQQFRKASWEDIRAVFEKQLKNDLEWFFKQWVDNAGLPAIDAHRIAVKQNGDAYEASISIGQRGDVYMLDVPLTVSFPDGPEKRQTVLIDKAKNNVTEQFDRMPEKIIIDGNYDIARHLDEDELPPVIARIIGAEQPVIAAAQDDAAKYRSVIEVFKERGAVERKAEELSDGDIKNATLIVLGKDNPLLKRLFSITGDDAGFTVIVKENPWTPRKVIGIINALSKEEADAASRKIFHYGKYSMLSFENGKNTLKSIEESQRGAALWKKEKTAAIDVAALTTLPEVIERVATKKIVYVGEFHNRFEHHAAQLEVIKGLYAKNKKIAIGMEMFQRPFQKTLDDFIAGTIDEREFLKKSEYFKRWSFDYNLYKPILSFARAEKIPVIALNIEREIIEKVSKGGIDALSEEERKEIPRSMDFSDAAYRERLKEVFQGHGHDTLKKRDFTNFYQSQILWDETMAQSIDAFFRDNPDYQASGQMVVIAGGGHLAYGAGIPHRAHRRNGYSYAIILNDGEIEKGIADYIAFPEQVDAVAGPKLMATLQEENGRVSIAEFSEQSIAKAAGLKVGDILLALDDLPVHSIEDVRIHLLYKKRGEPLRVKVMRKRFLFGDKVMEFTITL